MDLTKVAKRWCRKKSLNVAKAFLKLNGFETLKLRMFIVGDSITTVAGHCRLKEHLFRIKQY